MFAIIKTGGKQYAVREGEKMRIEKIDAPEGGELSFEVLLLADDEGREVKVGRPFVAGAKVTAKVTGHGLGEKTHVVKFKRKVRYHKNVGHRQPFTAVQIEKIAAP